MDYFKTCARFRVNMHSLKATTLARKSILVQPIRRSQSPQHYDLVGSCDQAVTKNPHFTLAISWQAGNGVCIIYRMCLSQLHLYRMLHGHDHRQQQGCELVCRRLDCDLRWVQNSHIANNRQFPATRVHVSSMYCATRATWLTQQLACLFMCYVIIIFCM